MTTNWTDTLRARQNGQRAGFALPTNLGKLNKPELVEQAEARGIDPAELSKEQLVAALEDR